MRNSDCCPAERDAPGGHQDRGGFAGRLYAEQPVRGTVVGQGEEHARRGAARQREAGRRPEHEHVVDPERVVHDRRRPGRGLVPLLGGRVVSGLTASDNRNQPHGGYHHEVAQRQKAAPAADHCVLSSGSNEHVCVAGKSIGSGPGRSQQPLADSARRCTACGRRAAGRAVCRWRLPRPATRSLARAAPGSPCRRWPARARHSRSGTRGRGPGPPPGPRHRPGGPRRLSAPPPCRARAASRRCPPGPGFSRARGGRSSRSPGRRARPPGRSASCACRRRDGELPQVGQAAAAAAGSAPAPLPGRGGCSAASPGPL